MDRTHLEVPEQAGSTRRTVLRGGVLAAGTAAVWTAPVATVLGLSPLSAAQASSHGPLPPPPPPPPVFTRGAWRSFQWDFDGEVVSIDPFTAPAGGAQVLLVDAYLKGDRFELLEGGTSLGTTNAVPEGDGTTAHPDTAWSDPTYSKGTFFVGAGPHSLSIRVFTPYLESGSGYFRIDPAA